MPVIGSVRQIGRREVDERLLAQPQPNLPLIGLEAPGQRRIDVGVEPHGNPLIADRNRARNAFRLRGAAVAGGLAEHPVERHGGERQADHSGDQASERGGGDSRVLRSRPVIELSLRNRRESTAAPPPSPDGRGRNAARSEQTSPDGRGCERSERVRERGTIVYDFPNSATYSAGWAWPRAGPCARAGALPITGNSSCVWNGAGEGTVHSKVVAPSPHGLATVTRFPANRVYSNDVEEHQRADHGDRRADRAHHIPSGEDIRIIGDTARHAGHARGNAAGRTAR